MTKEIVTINKGYKITEKTTMVDAVTAYKILSTSKQSKHTSAEYLMDSKQVRLTRHICICPYCNAHIPAYSHSFFEYQPKKKMSAKQAKSWCYELRPFFDIENDTFDFYKPIEETEGLSCPYCGGKASVSDFNDYIIFEYNKSVITVSCILNRIVDVINIDWAPTIKMTSLPLTESVTFNVKKGKTFFTLSNEDGDVIAKRDVTNGLAVNKQASKLIGLINGNVHIKRKLLDCFELAWGKSLPFSFNEIDIHKSVLLTSYVGYDNITFYDNIPSLSGEISFDSAFKSMRKKLHYADACVDVLTSSDIPQSKSIKAEIYRNPDFLFFTKEIEVFWKLFGEDHNLLLSFLLSETARANLMALHTYPSIMDFYSDFVNKKSSYEFNKIIIYSGKATCVYGIYYSALSKSKKTELQKTWSKLKGLVKYSYLYTPFSEMLEKFFITLPNIKLSERFIEQRINGYQFVALKSRQDFVTAGAQLDNCLGKSSFDNPVIGVKKAGKYVAAIEVDVENMIVVQARIANNYDIENDRLVFDAYKKWCKKNGVTDEAVPTYAF